MDFDTVFVIGEIIIAFLLIVAGFIVFMNECYPNKTVKDARPQELADAIGGITTLNEISYVVVIPDNATNVDSTTQRIYDDISTTLDTEFTAKLITVYKDEIPRQSDSHTHITNKTGPTALRIGSGIFLSRSSYIAVVDVEYTKKTGWTAQIMGALQILKRQQGRSLIYSSKAINSSRESFYSSICKTENCPTTEFFVTDRKTAVELAMKLHIQNYGYGFELISNAVDSSINAIPFEVSS